MNGDTNEVISVIVPVYNIEQYVDACVQSIVEQVYKNIEIILVDDGSQDRSGNLCDEWGAKDKRIKVIHKENAGLSEARNNGMKVATGKYIVYVDGDDIIAPQMLKKLHTTMMETGSDGVFCREILIDDKIMKWNKSVKEETACKQLSVKEAQLGLINHVDMTVVWNGLYKKELIKNIGFPKGKKNEDIFWKYLAYDKMQKIAYIPDQLYGYRIRSGSLMQQKFSMKDFDCLEGIAERADFLINKYPDLRGAALTDLQAYCMMYYIKTKKFLRGTERKNGLALIKKYRKNYKIKLMDILREKNISKLRKYNIAMACVSFPLASVIKELLMEWNIRHE